MSSHSSAAEEQRPAIPPATGLSSLVGFFFAARIFIMLLSVRLLGTTEQVGVEISLTLNFFLLTLVAFQTMGATDRESASMLRFSGVGWILLFLCFSCVSLLWSATASMPAAIIYWCAMAADVGMVALLIRMGPVKEVVTSLMKGYVIGACVIALIAWLLPAQSDLRLGDEELLGPNQIGYLCAFALFFVQYLLRERPGKWGLATFVLAVTLLRSLSKTSIIAFLIAELFLLIRDTSMRRRTKVLLILAGLATVAAFSSLLASYFDIYTSAGNSPETLTGRIGIWTVILSEAIQQPWIGHGFHAVWNVIPPFGDFEARHAHNELIQQFYAYGVVGICMLAGLYGSFYRQVRRLSVGHMRTLWFALLLFVLIRGLTDTEPFDLSLPLWSVLMLGALIEHEKVGQNDKVVGERVVRFDNRLPSGSYSVPQ
ncbi:MAG TPA: O-antigen ligase family protein [Acidobacteriaceae bacterium]|jgi:exopolysaccharide production protein ExoQ|nr:O-antigen ligase family protein [Acidobacteriaceae bacterium]